MDFLSNLAAMGLWSLLSVYLLAKFMIVTNSKVSKLNGTANLRNLFGFAGYLASMFLLATLCRKEYVPSGQLEEQPALQMVESESVGNFKECLTWLDKMPRDHGWDRYIDRHRSALSRAVQVELFLAANRNQEGLTHIEAAVAEVAVDDKFLSPDKDGGFQKTKRTVPSFEILRARCLGRLGRTSEATAALAEVETSILKRHKNSPHWSSGVLLAKIQKAKQEIDRCQGPRK